MLRYRKNENLSPEVAMVRAYDMEHDAQMLQLRRMAEDSGTPHCPTSAAQSLNHLAPHDRKKFALWAVRRAVKLLPAPEHRLYRVAQARFNGKASRATLAKAREEWRSPLPPLLTPAQSAVLHLADAILDEGIANYMSAVQAASHARWVICEAAMAKAGVASTSSRPVLKLRGT